MTELRHVLVVANETVAGKSLIELLERRRARGRSASPSSARSASRVTATSSTRTRAAPPRGAGSTARSICCATDGIAADGFVVDADPVDVVRDAFKQLVPPPDEVSSRRTPSQRSSWLRRDVVDRIESAVDVPVEHVVVDLAR